MGTSTAPWGAEKLGLVKTGGIHASSILAKLRLADRGQAAAAAHDGGVPDDAAGHQLVADREQP